MTSFQAITLESKLGFSEIQVGFAILQHGPMGIILNFYWCAFRKKKVKPKFLAMEVEVQYFQF